MGCSQSTPSRTKRRRRRKRSRQPYSTESKEMSMRQSAAPAAATFIPERDQFKAPAKNYKSEHIDQTAKMTEKPGTSLECLQATYTGIYNMRIHYADPEPCRIRGAEFLPTGELVVCDQANRSLKLWSTTFQYLAHYNLPGKPHDLCLHSSNRDGSDVYVTIPSDRLVMEFYVEGSLIVPGPKFRTEGFCYGIAPYKYGLVAGVGSKIQFMDTDGNVLRTLNHESGGFTNFGSPFHLAVTDAYNVLVSDPLKGHVLCVTPDGDVIFRYDEISVPHGMLVDKEENVYICGNESGAVDVLHQITVRGLKVKSLLSWRHVGFTPDAIAYREKDRLMAVCGNNDRIKTFRMDKRRADKIHSNDAIMDSERIQTERSTQEVQEIMKRILAQ